MTTYLTSDKVEKLINDVLEENRPVNTKVWSLQALCVAKIEQYSCVDSMIRFRALPDAEYPKKATRNAMRLYAEHNYFYGNITSEFLMKIIKKELGGTNVITLIELCTDFVNVHSGTYNNIGFRFSTFETNYYTHRNEPVLSKLSKSESEHSEDSEE